MTCTCVLPILAPETDCSIPRRSYKIHHWYIIHVRQDRFVVSVYRTFIDSRHKVVVKG